MNTDYTMTELHHKHQEAIEMQEMAVERFKTNLDRAHEAHSKGDRPYAAECLENVQYWHKSLVFWRGMANLWQGKIQKVQSV